MNDVTPQEKKRALPLPIMVLGFIGIIILMAWISIKVVNLAPSAFSSLASLAETLNDRQEKAALEAEAAKKIVVASNLSIVNSEETATLSWGEASVPGTFTFAYACADGITVDLIDTEGVRNINCDTNYNIGNITEANLTITSTKHRYADLDYTIAFLGTNDTTPRASGTGKLTVLNTEVTDSVLATEDAEDTTPVEEVIAEETAPEPETPAEEPVKPTKPATPSTPTYTEEYVYTVPVSNPNGRTDLGTTYLGTGTIIGQTFFAGKIEKNESGAIQFEVKNYGTKTSSNWTFSVELPDDTTYTSSSQLPLKPNERAVLTIGFSTTNASSHTFVVKVADSSDTTTINNAFKKTVSFY